MVKYMHKLAICRVFFHCVSRGGNFSFHLIIFVIGKFIIGNYSVGDSNERQIIALKINETHDYDMDFVTEMYVVEL